MSQLEAVIFDMDGVIIDSEPIHGKIERKLFAELGIEMSKEEHESFLGMTMEDLWSEIVDKYQVNYTIEELIQLHKERVLTHMSKVENFPLVDKVEELIKEFAEKEFKLAVASSSPRKLIEIVLTRSDLKGYFDFVISGEEVKNGKPAPDIFKQGATGLEVNPANCLVIEDSAHGVAAAKKAGMKCIGFRNVNSGNQDLSAADLVVDSMVEIKLNKL